MPRHTYIKTQKRLGLEDRITEHLTRLWYRSFTIDELTAAVVGRGPTHRQWQQNMKLVRYRCIDLTERGVLTESTRPGVPCRPYYTIGPVTQAIMSAKPSQFSNKSAVDNAGGACNNGAKILQCTHGEGEAHG